MNDQRDLEQELRVHFDARADRTVLDGQLEAVVARAAAVRQRPGWLAVLRSTFMTTTTTLARPTTPRLAWALVLLGLLIVFAVGAFIVGSASTSPSPFNGMISFGREDVARGDAVAYVINPDGTHERQLRPEVHEATFWSPNGDQVGFTNGLTSADGTGYKFFGDPFQPLYVPCWDWSPDGARCLAEGWNETDTSQDGLYLLSASDRTNPVQLTHHRDVPGVFSRDGSLVAFHRDDHLWVIGVDGTGERQLGTLNTGGDLSFAADDQSILMTSGEVLYRVYVATGTPTPIRIQGEPAARIWGGVYSPDGSRILFRRPIGEKADLFTMRVDGTDVVRLTKTPMDEGYIDWGTRALDD
jgi:hypothetical protein